MMSIYNNCKIVSHMNQFFSLYEHINIKRGSSRKVASLFPLNGEQNVQKVISHEGTKQIWVMINTTQQKDKSFKKLTQYFPELLEICICSQEKSVCAKLVKGGETIVECYDCRADSSCIICLQCFQNGNHKGHRVVFKKAGGGCCDCGDVQAWKQEGFCSKHTGKTKEISIEVKEIEFVREILFELFYLYSFLKLSGNKSCNDFFKGFITLLSSMAGRGVKGMKLISLFLDADLPKKYAVSSKLFGKMLQIVMTLQFSEGDFRSWQNLFIELFPYYPFKQQLIAGYIKSFRNLYRGEYRGGESVSCQIMTSYKLVEDYVGLPGAIPIIIEEEEKMADLVHLTKMLSYDLYRINHLQGDAPVKYWGLQIRYGIASMFGYYETLKSLARRQKERSNLNELEISKKKKMSQKKKKNKKIKKDLNLSDQQIGSLQEQKACSYSVLDFLMRNTGAVQSQFFLISQFMEILPQLAKNRQLLLNLLRQLMTNIAKEITFGDDLLIYRPYQRMFGITLFYVANQTPFLLTTPQIKQIIREASGLSEQKLQWWLFSVQKRMMETYCFFSHLQTCEGQGYHNSFYTYIALYNSKNCILGSLDLLVLKQLILLGGREVYLDFKSLLKLQIYQNPNVWNLKTISTLVLELGLLYTGYFAQIYLSNYGEKSEPAQWIQFEAKKVLKKFITGEGGCCSLQRVKQFAQQYILTEQGKVKHYLKQLCSFNKERKVFQLLGCNIDKDGINFVDFSTRGKFSNQTVEAGHPRNTIQFLQYHNKKIFQLVWNKTNLESLCAILLSFHDDIQKRSKEQLIQYFSIPCKLHYLLKNCEIGVENYGPLIELLQNFEVSGEIRKSLGVLVNQLSPVEEQSEMQGEGVMSLKQIQKQKKQKKLQELKKRNSQNMVKIKQKHEIESQPIQAEGAADECVICKKKGGNLVWVSKMCLKNLQKLLGFGQGALTLSFTSCYHAFDYECIIQNSVKRSTHEVLFRCPVCRRVGNTLITINNTRDSQVYIDAALDRIMQVALSLRNYREFNTVEEVLKSFYHYVMVGYLKHEYVGQRRARLYRQVLQMLINMKSFEQIVSAEKNLESNRIVLNPKIVKQIKQKINLEQVEVEEFDQDDFDDLQEIHEIMDIEEHQMMEESMKTLKYMEKPKEEKPKRTLKQEPSSLFNYTLKRVIDFVKSRRGLTQIKMQIESQPGKVNLQIRQQDLKVQKAVGYKIEDIPSWARVILDELFDEQYKQSQSWVVPRVVEIVDLPGKYYWDMTENVCDGCGKMCDDMFVCLLCRWKGCLNSCRRGGLQTHNKRVHGQGGIFFRLKDANLYLIIPGEIKKVGCLYMNEWFEDFDRKKDWGDYSLQVSILDKGVEMMLWDE